MKTKRRFVIGDVHGCAKALRGLIEEIKPDADDQLIFLGDYVDRGPDSRDVVDQIISLQNVCHVVALRGNHEIMLMGVALHGLDSAAWLRGGGQATVTSYGGSLAKIPSKHFAFFQDLRAYHETPESIFVHANYQHDRLMGEQDDASTYWTHLSTAPPQHHSGKRVFVGHTPQPSGNILDLGHLVCVDTYCFGGGFLTALDIDNYETLQVDRHGHPRRSPLSSFVSRLGKYRQGLGNLLRDKFSDAENESRANESLVVEPRGETRPPMESTAQLTDGRCVS